MNTDPTSPNEKGLRETLEKDPADWDARKKLAHLLYDRGDFQDAADTVWAADEIPSIDLELAFAARVLAKAAPRKAIRLLTALLEHNQGKAVQNLGIANALLHHGMVLQAARFYGAAMEADPSLGNPDLEHFILWTDDEETLWGDFKNRRPKLGDLPWMKRDAKEAMELTSAVSHHTTPVRVANLPPAVGEELGNERYEQKAEKGGKPTPPPAVTIPMDRVDPKHLRIDPELGAETVPESKPAEPKKPAAAAPAAKPDAPGLPKLQVPPPKPDQTEAPAPKPSAPSLPKLQVPPPKPDAASTPAAPQPAKPAPGSAPPAKPTAEKTIRLSSPPTKLPPRKLNIGKAADDEAFAPLEESSSSGKKG